MKIRFEIEVELDSGYILHSDNEERMFFEDEVLVADGSLFLHSNTIGDTVGEVVKIKNLEYL